MIGKISLDDKTAILNDVGIWESADQDFAAFLNLAYSPSDRTHGVGAVLPFGHLALADAGRELDAKVEYANPLKPLPPDVLS